LRKNLVTIALSVLCLVPTISEASDKSSKVAVAKSTASKVVKKVSQPLRMAMGWTQRGTASFYSKPQKTAWGGWYNPWSDTMAHRTLPKGTLVKVTYHKTGRSTFLTVADRGPYKDGRIADLSEKAAHDLGMISSGIGKVTLQVVNSASKAKINQSNFEIAQPPNYLFIRNNLAMANNYPLEEMIN
jgi:rare lipoprotein A